MNSCMRSQNSSTNLCFKFQPVASSSCTLTGPTPEAAALIFQEEDGQDPESGWQSVSSRTQRWVDDADFDLGADATAYPALSLLVLCLWIPKHHSLPSFVKEHGELSSVGSWHLCCRWKPPDCAATAQPNNNNPPKTFDLATGFDMSSLSWANVLIPLWYGRLQLLFRCILCPPGPSRGGVSSPLHDFWARGPYARHYCAGANVPMLALLPCGGSTWVNSGSDSYDPMLPSRQPTVSHTLSRTASVYSRRVELGGWQLQTAGQTTGREVASTNSTSGLG